MVGETCVSVALSSALVELSELRGQPASSRSVNVVVICFLSLTVHMQQSSRV